MPRQPPPTRTDDEERGVSDPPLAGPGWPRPRPRGSLTPRLSVSPSTRNAILIQPCNVGSISRADDVDLVVPATGVIACRNALTWRRG